MCCKNLFMLIGPFFFCIFLDLLKFFVIKPTLCYSSCKYLCVSSLLKDFKIRNIITYFTHKVNENLHFNVIQFFFLISFLVQEMLPIPRSLSSSHPKVLPLTVRKPCALCSWCVRGSGVSELWIVCCLRLLNRSPPPHLSAPLPCVKFVSVCARVCQFLLIRCLSRPDHT